MLYCYCPFWEIAVLQKQKGHCFAYLISVYREDGDYERGNIRRAGKKIGNKWHITYDGLHKYNLGGKYEPRLL